MNKKLCYFFPCSKGRLFDVCGSYIYKFTNVCIPYDSAKQLEEVLAICTPDNLHTSLNLLHVQLSLATFIVIINVNLRLPIG